jgi:catechol 2,3-dioxygenase-like lactoylglutathione lyase family enzyme
MIMDHVGLSVVDLDRSIAFYRDALGMELVGESQFDGEQYSRLLGLPDVRGRVALLRKAGMQLELFQFLHPVPAGADHARPVSNHGITHFGIAVDDMEGAYRRLESAGAVFHCPPLDFPGKGTATYGRDPDGNVFELLKRCRPG